MGVDAPRGLVRQVQVERQRVLQLQTDLLLRLRDDPLSQHERQQVQGDQHREDQKDHAIERG